MDEKAKEILLKQMELLQQKSQEAKESAEALVVLSTAMVAVANVLRDGTQSFYGDGTCHPYVVQLPVKDLIELYAARARRVGRETVAQRM